MLDFDFSKIKYRRPYDRVSDREITELIGFDSEAYGDGSPFMFCTSDGKVWKPEQLPEALFTREYRGKHFMVWNLRYESGALLRGFKRAQLEELQEQQQVTVDGFVYRYYPHKFLRITKGKNCVTFWDGAGFYQMGLEAASSRYLGKHKLKQNVKNMSRAYVRRNWDKLARYCIQDSVLTRDLGHYLLRYLNSFGVHPSALYSQASISFLYFKKAGAVVDVWRFWGQRRRLLYFACSAYAGGKFEMTRRGAFEGHMYDISSAYPFEMSQLPDISDAQVIHSDQYQGACEFGFVHAEVDLARALHHPIPLKHANVNTYPSGFFTTYLSKPELDYLRQRKVPVKIIEGYWLKCSTDRRPYAEVIANIYRMKEQAGEADIMKYDLCKKIANGKYGKLVQLTELSDGTLRAGPGWNPIYGAHITAKVRVRMAEAQELLGKSCYAVHTDSVLTEKRLPASMLSDELGGWKLKKSGKGVIVACGIYELAGKSANRGYEMKAGFKWTEQLEAAGNAKFVKLTEHRPLSWVGGVNTGHVDRINRFMDFPKQLNLNSDVKRIWPKELTARQLLESSQLSLPRVVFSPP